MKQSNTLRTTCPELEFKQFEDCHGILLEQEHLRVDPNTVVQFATGIIMSCCHADDAEERSRQRFSHADDAEERSPQRFSIRRGPGRTCQFEVEFAVVSLRACYFIF